MSRSRKNYAIFKDKGFRKKNYWKTIRRTWRQEIKTGKDISNPRTIINDYDYCDYIISLNNYNKVTNISQLVSENPLFNAKSIIRK